MKNGIYINNSKRLIVGISIMFFTVILIIGLSYAYFTQSKMNNMDNIVTTNINNTIGYSDSVDYMRNNLIPVIEEEVSSFVMKNSLNNYTNEDICKYQDNMYACSLYEFTITNNADVTQDMKVTLNPSPNGFTNLYYLVYEGKQDKLTSSSIVAKKKEHIEQENSSTMIKSLILKPGETKTYTVVFYIKSKGYDQTMEDAGKRFGAIIRVDSITTGKYLSRIIGKTCYEMEEILEGDYVGTYKLTKFNGIDENGNADESCGVTKDVETGFYSITIPSKVGNNEISTLSNDLFMGINVSDMTLTNYSKINNIVIEEGIKVIENGNAETIVGTFIGVGIDELDQGGSVLSMHDINVNIPSSLISIGDMAFYYAAGVKELVYDENIGFSQLETIGMAAFSNSSLTNIFIPSSVVTIGDHAFQNDIDVNVEEIIFEGASTNESQLKSIGESAFVISKSNVTSLIIPASVEMIKDNAFDGLGKIENLEFVGVTDGTSQLKTIGNRAFNAYDGTNVSTSLKAVKIPASVETIGNYAFSRNEGLSSLEFVGAIDGTSQLKTIGRYAFEYNNLTYTDSNNPLIIPSSVTAIGHNAFAANASGENRYLNYIKFNGTLTLGNTDWYSSSVTTLIS